MAKVVFNDYRVQVKQAMDNAINAALEECAGEIKKQTQQNSRVDTGRTKNSFQHKVDDDNHIAYIGSDYENAIWEEFGTGEYALHGDGRKGGWRYQDAQGNWHYTNGKRPSRAFWNAYITLKDAVLQRLQDALKGL